MGSYVSGIYVPSAGESGASWQAGVTAALRRLGEVAVNVKGAPFGAVGDDTADDTAAINAAISSFRGNSASLGKGALLIPPGIYRVSDTLLFDFKQLTVWMHGAVIHWTGDNTRPVIRIQNSNRTVLWYPTIKGQPGVAGNKATAAISFNQVAGFSNSLNHIIGPEIGPVSPETQAITFANGILWEGVASNNDRNIVDNPRIHWCDTGINIGQTQYVNNDIRSAAIQFCGTAFRLRAHTRISRAQLSSNTLDFDLASACLVTADEVTSELAGRLLQIRGSSQFYLRGGYWQASANITAGGDFINGVDNSQHQEVSLENWNLTLSGGYAGPTPIISLKALAAGSASKMLRLIGVWPGITAANLDVSPVTATDFRVVEGLVYSAASSVYRAFRNVLTATGQTVDFTRNDLGQVSRYATVSRPSAATQGAGAVYYDTTLNKPIWSDGTNWRDSAGTIV